MSTIQTVTGEFEYPRDGLALTHEHLSFDLSVITDNPLLRIRDVALVQASLAAARQEGLALIVDASPADIGRNVLALREISLNSGVYVVAATGSYRQIVMGRRTANLSADVLASTMVRELTEGIEGTGIVAGVIGEIGTDGEEFTDGERANFVAAAAAQQETQAPILTHTPNGRFGYEQAALLIRMGVDPRRICIGHIDCEPDLEYYGRLVDLGVWLGFDRIGSGRAVSDKVRAETLREIVRHEMQRAVLISGDTATESRLAAEGYEYPMTSFWCMTFGRDAEDLKREMFSSNPHQFFCG